MLLQCNIEVPVWWWAAKGKDITLFLNGQKLETNTDKNVNNKQNK